jgi:hypothetical protein
MYRLRGASGRQRIGLVEGVSVKLDQVPHMLRYSGTSGEAVIEIMHTAR